MYCKVAAFQRAFGQSIAESPGFPAHAIRELRIALLREEVEEYFAAERADDLIEVADALADIIYILAGTCVSYGIAPQEPVAMPFCQLLTSDALAVFPTADKRAGRLHEVARAFTAYLVAERDDNLDGVQAALRDLLFACAGTGYVYGIPLDRVFDEVHDSNMSKLGADGRPMVREDGKILKPSSFRPPNIAAILFPETS